LLNRDKFREACEKLKEDVEISEYLIKNKHAYGDVGDEGIIRCPFPDHDDGTASFSFDNKKGLFNCFGCGRGGDVVNLHYYMLKVDNDRYTRIKAVNDLSRKFNVKLPDMFEQRFKRGRVNKFRRANTKLENVGNSFYTEKIRGIESSINKLSNKSRVRLYRKIDDMLLGRRDAKEVYFDIKGVIRNESN